MMKKWSAPFGRIPQWLGNAKKMVDDLCAPKAHAKKMVFDMWCQKTHGIKMVSGTRLYSWYRLWPWTPEETIMRPTGLRGDGAYEGPRANKADAGPMGPMKG